MNLFAIRHSTVAMRIARGTGPARGRRAFSNGVYVHRPRPIETLTKFQKEHIPRVYLPDRARHLLIHEAKSRVFPGPKRRSGHGS